MRFSGVNSFVLACKEIEKVGLIPAFNYSEVRHHFKNLKTPIAYLDAIFFYKECDDLLSIIFYDNKGNDVISFDLKKDL